MTLLRFARRLAPEDVCEELKDGQWPDPSDCKSYFLCRGVGSQWGEQKREVCYAGKTTNSSVPSKANSFISQGHAIKMREMMSIDRQSSLRYVRADECTR